MGGEEKRGDAEGEEEEREGREICLMSQLFPTLNLIQWFKIITRGT